MSGSDAEILALWSESRDAEAFTEIVSRYAALVYTACLRILRNAAEAEDLTQQCFLELAQRPPIIRTSLGGWLHQAATHRALNHLRSERRRRERERRFTDDYAKAQQHEWDEIAEHIDDAIAALKPGLREVVVLRYLRGHSQEKVAQALNLAPRTVRYRQQQAIEAIRRHLRRRGIAVKASLASLLAVNLAEQAQAALLPSSLQTTLGRIALSGIVPRTSVGTGPAAAAARAVTTLTTQRASGAIAAAVVLLALGAAIYVFRSGGDHSPQRNAAGPQPAAGVAAAAATEPPAEPIAAPARQPGTEEADYRITAEVSDPDGRPVKDAVLRTNSAEILATVDRQGRLAIEALPEQCRKASIEAENFSGYELNPFVFMWHARIHLEVVLPKPLDTAMRLVDAQGRPAAGAEVFVAGSGERIAVADDQGRFVAPDDGRRYVAVRPGLGEVDVVYESGGVARLTQPARLILCARWDGQPTPNVEITYQDPRLRREVTVTTGEDGRAEVANVPAKGELLLNAELPRTNEPPLFGTAVARPRPNETTDCDIVLEDVLVGELRGRILWENGAPVEAADIHVRSASSSKWVVAAKMGPGGRFEVPLFSGTNLVSEWKHGRPWVDPAMSQIVVSPGQTQFYRELRLVHSINPDFSGEFVVTLDYLKASRPNHLMVSVDEWRLGPSFCWIEAPGDERLRLRLGHRGAPWLIAAVDPESRRAGVWRRPTGGEKLPATLRLDTAVGELHGVLEDGKGMAVPYGSVTSNTEGDFPPVTVQANVSGEFVLWPVPIGQPVSIKAWAPGRLAFRMTVAPGQASQRLRMTLPQTDSVVAGQVLYEDGAPVLRGAVWWDAGYLQCPITDGQFRLEVPRGSGVLHAKDGFVESEPVAIQAPAENMVISLPKDSTLTDSEEHQELLESSNILKQFGIVFRMFSNEQQDRFFPPLSQQQGGFHPDMTQIYPEYLTDPALMARATGYDSVQTCYLGYVLDSKEVALEFLDAYAELGPAAIHGEDVAVSPGNGSFGGDTIFRLSENFDWTEEVTPSTIPVMWEVPGPGREAGGWVLYMDGHTEWKPYPGDFPMTDVVVSRINKLRNTLDAR